MANGRDIALTVNQLLSQPSVVLRVATQDWHPPTHVSFASNHPGRQPFTDHVTIVNPGNPAETYESRLWPVHCVQGSSGADLVPELDRARVDHIIRKGQDARVEMYSPFYDPFEAPRGCDSGLAQKLRDARVTHVYVVGLAADYCVLNCAVDAVKEGFQTFIVEEGTRAVDPEGWPKVRQELEEKGVRVVGMASAEVQRLMKDE